MTQIHSETAHASPRAIVPPPVSPLLISDRLISLAEQAGEAGCTATARHLIRLASRVLDEKRPPLARRTLS